MSVQAIGWALSVQTGSPGSKFVLVALANYADAGGVCWPSQALIAKQTEQSTDSVQRRMKELEELGFIKRERRQNRDGVGGRISDRYRLSLMPQVAAKAETNPEPEVPYTANEGGLSRTVAVSNEPSLRPIKSKKDNKAISGKRGKPKHLAKNKDRVWCDKGTDEWKAYADDYRTAHKGRDPPTNWSDSGSWFNILGEKIAA